VLLVRSISLKMAAYLIYIFIYTVSWKYILKQAIQKIAFDIATKQLYLVNYLFTVGYYQRFSSTANHSGEIRVFPTEPHLLHCHSCPHHLSRFSRLVYNVDVRDWLVIVHHHCLSPCNIAGRRDFVVGSLEVRSPVRAIIMFLSLNPFGLHCWAQCVTLA